jgi:hypothetical protein
LWALAHEFTRANDCNDLGALSRNFSRASPLHFLGRSGAKKPRSERHISPSERKRFAEWVVSH